MYGTGWKNGIAVLILSYHLLFTKHDGVNAENLNDVDRASQCRSFYDHVCRNPNPPSDANETEEIDRPSLVDWIESRRLEKNAPNLHSSVMRIAHDACMRYRAASLTLDARLSGVYEAYKPSDVYEAYKPSDVYEASLAMAKHDVYIATGAEDARGETSFPITAIVSKKLTHRTWCVDLSPSTSWIAAATEILIARPTLEGEEDLVAGSDPLREILMAYASESANADARYGIENTEAFLNYAHDYSDFGSSLLSPFWKDVVATLYPTVSNSTCVHLNGFSEYYRAVESHVSNPILLYGPREDDDADENDVKEMTENEADAFCKKAVKRFAAVSWNHDYLSTRTDESKDDKSVFITSLVNRLKEISVDVLKTNTLLDDPTRRAMEIKMNAIRPIVLSTPFPNHAVPHLLVEKNCIVRLLKKNETAIGDWTDMMECLALAKHRRDSNLLSNPDAFLDHVFYDTDASTVNAWYDPTANVIVVPEGILETPFFFGPPDETVDDINATDINATTITRTRFYSDMGMILGHELWHSVDVHGLCWTENGDYDLLQTFCFQKNLPFRFTDRMECMKKDYGHPCGPGDGYGDRTLGEDMADYFGTLVSFLAFQKDSILFDSTEPERRLFERRFFVEYARMWCQKKVRIGTTAFKRVGATDVTTGLDCKKIEADVHALPRHRVDKTLRHLNVFSEVFDCPSKSPMNAGNASCSLYSTLPR